MGEPESTTFRTRPKTAEIIRRFSEAIAMSQIDLMDAIFGEVGKALDDLYEGKRLLFMCDYDLKNKMIHIRLSNAFLGCDTQLDLPMNEVEKLFGYRRDAKGHLIDLREKEKEIEK